MAKRKINTDQIRVLEIEYSQVCQNIREGWTYVMTIIRQFITLQIVLISFVGLGNFLVPINIPINIESAQNISEINNDIENSGAATNNPDNSYSRPNILTVILSTGSIIILIILGILISYGAKVQIRRIFDNSQKFVERAAAIENKIGSKKLNISSTINTLHAHSYNKETYPSHIYMLSRLENKDLKQMDVFIAQCFNISFWIWMFVFVLQALSILKHYGFLDAI